MVGLNHLLFNSFVGLIFNSLTNLAISPRIKETILLYSHQEGDLIEKGKVQNPLLKDRRKVQVFLQVSTSKQVHKINLMSPDCLACTGTSGSSCVFL